MIGLTVWDDDGMTAALDGGAEALLRELPVGVVNLHSWPRAELAPVVARVRAVRPEARLWLSPGVNGLADDDVRAVERQARAWRDAALHLGAEVVLVNAEGAAKPGLPGWKYVPETRAALADRARALLAGLSGSTLQVAFTSHDCPDYHSIDWGVWLGKDSPVTIHAPQIYPGVKRPGASLASAQNRWRMATTQWRRWVARGLMREDLGPDGGGWCTYTQGWGAVPAATAWLLDQRTRGLVWAAPSRLWAEGTAALKATLVMRAECGDSAGAIARWQAAHALKSDGIVGPLTARAAGVAWPVAATS